MTTVSQLLKTKGYEVWSVRPDISVYEAIRIMAERDVGGLPVLEDGRLVGMITERDYARKVILRGRSSRDILVREIMTPRVFTIRPDQTVEECMVLMTARRFRHLPVLDGQNVVGLVSLGDVVKSMISQRDDLIQQLEHYIKGG